MKLQEQQKLRNFVRGIFYNFCYFADIIEGSQVELDIKKHEKQKKSKREDTKQESLETT